MLTRIHVGLLLRNGANSAESNYGRWAPAGLFCKQGFGAAHTRARGQAQKRSKNCRWTRHRVRNTRKQPISPAHPPNDASSRATNTREGESDCRNEGIRAPIRTQCLNATTAAGCFVCNAHFPLLSAGRRSTLGRVRDAPAHTMAIEPNEDQLQLFR